MLYYKTADVLQRSTYGTEPRLMVVILAREGEYYGPCKSQVCSEIKGANKITIFGTGRCVDPFIPRSLSRILDTL
jgi:hypothetical protein